MLLSIRALFVAWLLVGIVEIQRVEGFVPGYELFNPVNSPTGFTGFLRRLSGSQGPYGDDIDTLSLTVTFVSSEIIRVHITDANQSRWEVPDVVVSPNTGVDSDLEYQFSYTSSPFGFAISRAGGNEAPLFNTTPDGSQYLNGLIFEDQYIELSTQLPTTSSIYGIGERMFNLDLLDGYNYTLWNKDPWNGLGVQPQQGLYGSHPIYIDRRPSSSSHSSSSSSTLYHGVFLLNSNGMSVELMNGRLTYRLMGGVLDFYFFMGDSPSMVTEQYLSVIGKPYLPPYWALGYHHCRCGRDGPQGGLQDINITKGIYTQYLNIDFPLDVMWNDYDYMANYYSLLLDPIRYPTSVVSEWVSEMHASGHRYVVIADINTPINKTYVPYEMGMNSDVFVKASSGNGYMEGVLWGGNPSYFPDFSNPASIKWWTAAVSSFYNTTGIDGLWIDMNEPSVTDCNNCSILQPPFVPNDIENITLHTFDLEAKMYKSTVYNVHNVYGFYESIASHAAMTAVRGKRPFVLSRSTFPGSGRYTAHWLGDNRSNWRDLRGSISGIIQMNMFGIPMVGADICGFGGNTTPELCTRWMQLGAFYPFSRNHNAGTVPQEPYAFDEPYRSIMISAFVQKLSLSPVYYTLLYQAATTGTLVINPLFYVFPQDNGSRKIDLQFMVGTSLLVSPVVNEGMTAVNAYFPVGTTKTIWYDWFTGDFVSNGGETITLYAELDYVNVHVLGGSIVPIHPQPLNNTQFTRLTPFALRVALDAAGNAQGSLYEDDGESVSVGNSYTLVNYTLSNQVLQSNVISSGFSGDSGSKFYFSEISFYGIMQQPTQVQVNGQTTPFSYSSQSNTLSILNLQLNITDNWVVKWA